MYIWILGLMTTLMIFSTPAQAQTERVRLGTVSLTDQTDRDVVRLPLCRSSDNKTVSRLQLQVARFPAEINRLKVVYHNGQQQLLSVRQNFKVGTTSQWIDLSGAARCIKQIVIVGDTNTRARTNRRQAQITFWGFHPDVKKVTPKPHVVRKPNLGPVKVVNPPGPPSAVGLKLGQVRLTDRKDRDVIVLPPCKANGNVRVNRLRLKINQHPAEINRFKVVYHNGEMQVLSVKQTFRADSQSRWIDLKGNARCIKQIVIIGDTQSLGRQPGKQALVVVKGLHFSPR
jgi:hypothetical protein